MNLQIQMLPWLAVSMPKAQDELVWSLDVCCPPCVMRRQELLQMISPPKLLLDFDQLCRNDPYMALFNNCSNGSSYLHI